MYEKALAQKVYKLLQKKVMIIEETDDIFEAGAVASEMGSLLELFAEVIKLNEIETINIQIKEVKHEFSK